MVYSVEWRLQTVGLLPQHVRTRVRLKQSQSLIGQHIVDEDVSIGGGVHQVQGQQAVLPGRERSENNRGVRVQQGALPQQQSPRQPRASLLSSVSVAG